MTDEKDQKRVCELYGAEFVASPRHIKVGISRDLARGKYPINGLRHRPEGDTSGWYIYVGEEDVPQDPNFFVPLHVEHLGQRCPEVIPYLGLPPGWRFLIADGYEDVWFDGSLLEI